MALRRWKPFLSAFAHIDAAIEAAAAGSVSRAAFRRERDRIVEALCRCDADDAAAEGICRLLDAAMAESLLTLREAVSAGTARPAGALASGEAVGALASLVAGHESGRVRGLARGVLGAWRAAVEAELAEARAAIQVLDCATSSSARLPPPPGHTAPAVFAGCQDYRATKRQAEAIPAEKQARPKMAAPAPVAGSCGSAKAATEASDPAPKKSGPVLGSGCVRTPACREAASTTEIPAPPPKKTIGGAGNDRTLTVPSSCSAEEKKKMEATKRRLHERYQEAEDAKRRRTIRVIATAPPSQMQGRTQPSAVRARALAPCVAERCLSISSLRRV